MFCECTRLTASLRRVATLRCGRNHRAAYRPFNWSHSQLTFFEVFLIKPIVIYKLPHRGCLKLKKGEKTLLKTQE